MKTNRSNFSGKIGFILAAAGSAVGLGNIWRFPYLAAKYGGGSFLICYIILAVTFGFTLMVAEIAIGRKTGLSAIGAFQKLDKRFGFLGILAAIVPIIILPYYSVIGGWVLKYFYAFITEGAATVSGDSYFSEFTASTASPILWFSLFIALTALVVLFGVEKGIEKVSKVMMPILAVLTVGIAIYVLTMDGAMDGLKYYLLPNMSNFSVMTVLAAMGQLFYSMSLTVGIAIYVLTMDGAMDGLKYYLLPNMSNFSVMTVLAAMGQLFYSMSLAMGIMITYGSYMPKSTNLESSVRQIEIFDTGFAFFAGLMIVPSVFIFSGGDESALNAGAGLMFITLPKVFASMPLGTVLGTVFFILVFFAAVTSSISLMETIVSIFMDKFKWSRRFTCILVAVYSLLIGIPTSLGFGALDFIKPLGMSILDAMDFISNSVLMPIVAVLTCVFVGFADWNSDFPRIWST